jgi:hypothetical protein
VPAFTGLLLLRGRYSRKGYHIILEWGDLGISKLIDKGNEEMWQFCRARRAEKPGSDLLSAGRHIPIID